MNDKKMWPIYVMTGLAVIVGLICALLGGFQ